MVRELVAERFVEAGCEEFEDLLEDLEEGGRESGELVGETHENGFEDRFEFVLVVEQFLRMLFLVDDLGETVLRGVADSSFDARHLAEEFQDDLVSIVQHFARVVLILLAVLQVALRHLLHARQ